MKMPNGMRNFGILGSFILILIQFGVVVPDKGKPLVDYLTSCKGPAHLAKTLGVNMRSCFERTDTFIAEYGYAAEVHRVETEDGYILSVFRANLKNATFPNKKVVIIHHGLLSSSDDVAIPPPDEGLVYTLADRGYDVWVSNSRGSYYSRSHAYLDPDKKNGDFWKFSWDDIALYDYPAVYEYVKRKTGVEKFFVVGHSRGVTTLVTLLSQKPQYNNEMYATGLLAPPIYFEHATLLKEVVALGINYIRSLKNTEYFPRHMARSCAKNKICKNLLTMIVGHEAGKNKNSVPIYLCHFPSGTSANEFIHYAHMIKYRYFGGKMIEYDGNIPDEYKLDNITAPMSIHYSAIDHFTPELDVKKMIANLVNVRDKEVNFIPAAEEFEHADFVMGTKAKRLVYKKLLDFFDKYVKANNL